MTEERPIDGTDPDDARWFRDAVDPVVGDPVPDAWTAIRDRATGAVPPVIALAPPARTRMHRPRLLVAAALLAAVAVAGTLVAVNRADDDRRSVTGSAPIGPTGFYVPTGLPSGWEVTTLWSGADTSWGDLCPCDFAQWRSGGRSLAVTRVTEQIGTSNDSMVPWDGAPGGQRGTDESGTITYTWRSNGRTVVVGAVGFEDEDAVEQQAAAWAADGKALANPEGFDRAGGGSIGGDVRATISAGGTIENRALGLYVPFRLGPDPLGWAAAPAEGGSTPFQLAGSGLPVVRSRDTPPGLRGYWPGAASFEIGGCLFECTMDGSEVTADQIEALAASFRPATAEQWSDFVKEHGGDPNDPQDRDKVRAALARPRLADLVVHNGEPIPGEDPSDVDTDQPTADGIPTTTAAELPGPDVSGGPPATAVDQLSGSELTVISPTGPIFVSGPSLRLDLQLENRTDHPVERFCTNYRWALLDADGDPIDTWDEVPAGSCDVLTTMDAGETEPVSFNVRTQGGSASAGPGAFRAVVGAPGVGAIASVPIVVLPPDCDGAESVIGRFSGRPVADVEREIAAEPVEGGLWWLDGSVRPSPIAPLSERLPGTRSEAAFNLVATDGTVVAVCSRSAD